jgi:hypothetical protein
MCFGLMKIMGKGKGKTRIVAVGLKNKTYLKNKQYFRKKLPNKHFLCIFVQYNYIR